MRCVNRGDCRVAAVTKARAGGHEVGRRYLIALSCKEAEIFILKVFTGKTRLVFFARRRPALKGLITMRTIDERISEKKSWASDLSESSGTL
ncbi:hypothetical protein ALC60_03780 [Trachymyrmex zeteki]|uniref:Uncharacterized protein n=1 Tax=Mycetomoellerius zeteki TaxID=64791 RepID=A0A151XAF0_9HYME|nr:hypothetical protein ALC60_03780 [Trachymyrmex zeteki]